MQTFPAPTVRRLIEAVTADPDPDLKATSSAELPTCNGESALARVGVPTIAAVETATKATAIQ
jgi:hypothetical protein